MKWSLFLVLLLLSSFVSADCDFLYSFNVSNDLPTNFSEVVSVVGVENLTVVSSTDSTFVSSPNITSFINGSVVDAEINFSIPFFAVNDTELLIGNVSFFNSSENFSANFSFCFSFFNDSVDVVDWVRVGIGSFSLEVCDWNVPKNFSKGVVVSGDSGVFVNVSCNSSWLDCASFVMPGTGWFESRFNVSVPEVDVGVYDLLINFLVGNVSENVSLSVDVIDCLPSLPFVSLCDDLCENVTKFFDFGDTSLNVSYTEYKACLECQRLEDIERYDILLEGLDEREVEVIKWQNWTEKEYVPVFEVDESGKKFLSNMDEYISTHDQNVRRDSDIVNNLSLLSSRVDVLFSNINDSVKDAVKPLIRENTDLRLERDELRDWKDGSIRKSVVWGIIGFVILVVVVLWISKGYYDYSRW